MTWKFSASTWEMLVRMSTKRGSTFPRSLKVALPVTIVATVLKILQKELELEEWTSMWLHADGNAWGGFSTLVVFLMTFRVGQAFSRFSSALSITHQMQGEWSGAASSTAAFCKGAQDPEEANIFLHTAMRLFSILGACALQELSDVAQHHTLGLETLNSSAFDDDSIIALDSATQRVDLVYQWIQQLIAEGIRSGVLDVPAPIAGRIFTELATGMGKFGDALQHAKVEFPFPYAQTSLWLLIAHLILTPFMMVQWTEWASGCAIFTFVQIFFLWSLMEVCVMFESPFGGNIDHIEPRALQREFNKCLALLLEPATRKGAKLDPFAQITSATLQARGTLHQAALEREGWQLHSIENNSGKDSGCCSCVKNRIRSSTSESEAPRPKIAISDRYRTKQYGIVAGEKTAVYGVGIFENHLVIALPCGADDKDGAKECVMQVQNLDKDMCNVRMKKVLISQRHLLATEPDPDWGANDFTDFPPHYQFQPKSLANAYLSQLKGKALQHSKTSALETEEEQKRSEQVKERQEATGFDDILKSESQAQMPAFSEIHHISVSMQGPGMREPAGRQTAGEAENGVFDDILKTESELQPVGWAHIQPIKASMLGPVLEDTSGPSDLGIADVIAEVTVQQPPVAPLRQTSRNDFDESGPSSI